VSEPRPTKLTDAMQHAAARSTAQELADAGLIKVAEVDHFANDIATCGRPHMDGYDLAKELDERCFWACTLQWAEILDGFHYAADCAIRAAQKEWAERVSPRPPLPLNSRVTLPSGETGEITGVYAYGAAQYEIAIDGDPQAHGPNHSRRIVNFEDVQLIAAEASAS
jgi:hypothetical protein